MGTPEGEESEQRNQNLFKEIMTKNFFNLVKEKFTQVKLREFQTSYTQRGLHIIIKMTRLKDKERILTATREMQVVTYKGTPVRLSSDYSSETFQARREWHEIFKVMKSKDLQPRLLYLARLSFKIKGEIRSFPDKKKLKEFINTKPVLQQMLKGLL